MQRKIYDTCQKKIFEAGSYFLFLNSIINKLQMQRSILKTISPLAAEILLGEKISPKQGENIESFKVL